MKDDTQHEYHYNGIPTFMRSPYIKIDELENINVAVVGVPVDQNVSYRNGQRFGPRAIREATFWDSINGQEYWDFGEEAFIQSNDLVIGDLGDVVVYPGDSERTNKSIISTLDSIRSKAFPITLGGDHSITYGAFIGCNRALKDKYSSIGLLHFDAHPDIEEEYRTLARIHHGNVIGSLIREGYLDGHNVVTIGLRGHEPKEWTEFSKNEGMKRYSMMDIHRKTLSAILDESIQYLQKKCDGVYLTFDIDCIDPSQAPGTGTPEFGGIKVEEFFLCMKQLKRLPLIGFDLVEVSPPLDTSGITVVAACEILWHFLSFGFSS